MGRKDLAKKKSLNPLKVNSSFQIVLVPKNNYFEREMKVKEKLQSIQINAFLV